MTHTRLSPPGGRNLESPPGNGRNQPRVCRVNGAQQQRRAMNGLNGIHADHVDGRFTFLNEFNDNWS